MNNHLHRPTSKQWHLGSSGSVLLHTKEPADGYPLFKSLGQDLFVVVVVCWL